MIDQSKNGGQWISLGAYDFTKPKAIVTVVADSFPSYVVSDGVKENLIPLNTQAMQIRFYAWDFASPATTLRIDDIKMEAVIGDLPPPCTIISIR